MRRGPFKVVRLGDPDLAQDSFFFFFPSKTQLYCDLTSDASASTEVRGGWELGNIMRSLPAQCKGP